MPKRSAPAKKGVKEEGRQPGTRITVSQSREERGVGVDQHLQVLVSQT